MESVRLVPTGSPPRVPKSLSPTSIRMASSEFQTISTPWGWPSTSPSRTTSAPLPTSPAAPTARSTSGSATPVTPVRRKTATSPMTRLWDLSWRLHVMSHVYAAREVLPAMLERGDGYLLQTASVVALALHPDKAAYSVTKHAALGLSEWLAATYRPKGIKVSCFCPGPMLTPMLLSDGIPADHPMLKTPRRRTRWRTVWSARSTPSVFSSSTRRWARIVCRQGGRLRTVDRSLQCRLSTRNSLTQVLTVSCSLRRDH